MEYPLMMCESAAADGEKRAEYTRSGCRITRGEKPGGERFYTVTPQNGANVAAVLARYMKRLAGKKPKKVLVVGLGNRGMTADALGDRVLAHMRAGGDDPRICLIAPQVAAVTGVESADIVAGVSAVLKPCLTVFADTLATSRFERLGRCYQLGDFALSPGSGVGAGKTLKARGKTLSVGVPLVIDLKYLGARREGVVTPANVDELVEENARVIAAALGMALGRSQ